MKTNKPVTVVFYIQDQEKFNEFSDQFFESMEENKEMNGAIVTGIGMEDTMTILERYEEEYGDDLRGEY